MAMFKSDQLALLPALGTPGVEGAVGAGFRATAQAQPDVQWATSFAAMWPAYRAWYLTEGDAARPDLLTCTQMLEKWMPELLPTFERLVSLAGGDPLVARFLSMYRPPGFVVGCSQVAFTGEGGPALLRNYDYAVARTEGIIYATSWTGRRVIGMSDCLWGLLDGINDAGLAVSLTFGGRPAVGDGFGIPLVIRYLLEVCETVAHACEVLERMPIHAAQNITMLDRGGDFATVQVGPGREPQLLNVPVATNHQRHDDWPEYATAVRTFEREQRLLALLRDPEMSSSRLIEAFLEPPLYRTEFASGLGTLYTAAYFPAEGRVEYHWPMLVSAQSFEQFTEGYPSARHAGATAGTS